VHRVKANDPSASTLVFVALKSTGLESDATLQDYANLSTLLAAANDEATNSGYARKVLTDSDIADITIDNTANSVLAFLPDQTWTSVQTSGGGWGALLVCYSPSAGADSTIIPLTKHDFIVVPDGNDVIADFDVLNGFYSAV
jgi:hypothetical protein